MEELLTRFEKRLGQEGSTHELICNGEHYKGVLVGNDECFDCNDFYQYLITENGLYKMYFTIPEGCEDLGDVDYYEAYDCKLIGSIEEALVDF